MIKRIAQQVSERRFQLFQDFAVHADGLADYLKPDFLVQLPGQVPRHAGEALRAVGKRPHAADQPLPVKPFREVRRALRIELELFQQPGHGLAACIQLAAQLGDAVVLPRAGPGSAGFLYLARQLILALLQRLQCPAERLEPASLDHVFAHHPEHAVEVIRRNPDSLALFFACRRLRRRPCFGHGVRFDWARGALFLLRPRIRPLFGGLCARRRCSGANCAQTRDQLVNRRLIRGLPCRKSGLSNACYPGEHVHAAEQDVRRLRQDRDLPFLRGHETVFHGMGDFHGRVQVDDAAGALEGVRRSHHGCEPFLVARVALQREQALAQYRGLRFRLLPEQVQHGEAAQIISALFCHSLTDQKSSLLRTQNSGVRMAF